MSNTEYRRYSIYVIPDEPVLDLIGESGIGEDFSFMSFPTSLSST